MKWNTDTKIIFYVCLTCAIKLSLRFSGFKVDRIILAHRTGFNYFTRGQYNFAAPCCSWWIPFADQCHFRADLYGCSLRTYPHLEVSLFGMKRDCKDYPTGLPSLSSGLHCFSFCIFKRMVVTNMLNPWILEVYLLNCGCNWIWHEEKHGRGWRVGIWVHICNNITYRGCDTDHLAGTHTHVIKITSVQSQLALGYVSTMLSLLQFLLLLVLVLSR